MNSLFISLKRLEKSRGRAMFKLERIPFGDPSDTIDGISAERKSGRAEIPCFLKVNYAEDQLPEL